MAIGIGVSWGALGHVPPGGYKGAKKKGGKKKKKKKGGKKKKEKKKKKKEEKKGKMRALWCFGQTSCKHGAPTSLEVKYNV